MSLIESKMANAAGRMAELLATDMYLDGQGTNSSIIALDGFQSSIDDGSNFPTYGGITRSDIATGANLGINAYYVNIAGNLALSQLQTAYGSCWFGPERPDLLCTDQSTWNIIWNKLQPQQRFNEEKVQWADVAKATAFSGSPIQRIEFDRGSVHPGEHDLRDEHELHRPVCFDREEISVWVYRMEREAQNTGRRRKPAIISFCR